MCVRCYYHYCSQGRKEGDPCLFSPCGGPSTVPAFCTAHFMQFSGQLQKGSSLSEEKKGLQEHKGRAQGHTVVGVQRTSRAHGWMFTTWTQAKWGGGDMQQKETNQCSPGIRGWGWGRQDGRSGRADSGIPGEEACTFSHRHWGATTRPQAGSDMIKGVFWKGLCGCGFRMDGR